MIEATFEFPSPLPLVPDLPALFTGSDPWRTDISQGENGPAPRDVGAKRVMVIDDESGIADSLQEILILHGYEAVAFYDGQMAIDAARRLCPDIVLSDVVMPNLNGIDTVRKIRELCPRTRIMLFSGQTGTADIMEQARAQGLRFELLPKPIHPDQLLRQLSRAPR